MYGGGPSGERSNEEDRRTRAHRGDRRVEVRQTEVLGVPQVVLPDVCFLPEMCPRCAPGVPEFVPEVCPRCASADYRITILSVESRSPRRNGNSLAFRVKSVFSTIITSLDDA